jgi:hypothetical protein
MTQLRRVLAASLAHLNDAGRASTVVCALALWRVSSAATARTSVQRRRAGDDRGAGVVEYLALTLGGLMLAGVIFAILRGRGEEMANNVCTNADPTTC